jgi:hypothetical protein
MSARDIGKKWKEVIEAYFNVLSHPQPRRIKNADHQSKYSSLFTDIWTGHKTNTNKMLLFEG